MAEIIQLNADAERINNAERLGLDPDTELVSEPFPGDLATVRALGALQRALRQGGVWEAWADDFAGSSHDLGLYAEQGASAADVAQLTGLDEPRVNAFYEGYCGAAPVC